MLDFENEIIKFSIDSIKEVPYKIADLTVIDMELYNKIKLKQTEEDKLEYNKIESFLSKFMVNSNKIVLKYKDTHKLYILCTNYSKAITKRRIIQYLQEK